MGEYRLFEAIHAECTAMKNSIGQFARLGRTGVGLDAPRVEACDATGLLDLYRSRVIDSPLGKLGCEAPMPVTMREPRL